MSERHDHRQHPTEHTIHEDRNGNRGLDENYQDLDGTPLELRKSIDIPTPFGGIKIRGYDIIALGFIAYIAFTIYIFWIIKEGTEHAHKIIINQMAEQSFIIHLSPEERSALRLPMPESLRKRVGDEEYYNFLKERYRREVEQEAKDRLLDKNVPVPTQPTPPQKKGFK